MATDPSAPRLPILEKRTEIEDAIRAHQVVVVCGQTGSGKTTQLPRICLEMGLAVAPTPGRPRGIGAGEGRPPAAFAGEARPGLIGHTQPRRLAARAVAARIAEELAEPVGQTVGVKVRFADHTGPRTRIKVMTDGILLAELASDPDLSAYGVIIIDEAHERSLNIDFLLGYLRLLLPRRPDLRLIITSATIDPHRFSAFFSQPGRGGQPPVIEVSGRMYPVDVRYRPTTADDEDFDRVEFESVADAVADLVAAARPAGGRPAPQRPGDVLVFLPGERDIRLAGDAIARRGIDAEVLPLYSRLTDQQQDRIFHPAPGGRPRVILSTNIAETSLTVPGIRFVVDTGLARLSRYDPERKIQRLPIEPISRASADQRAGRCGRVAAGVCVRLYSEASYRERPAFTDPEIRRTSLADVILRMLALRAGRADADDRPADQAPGALLPPVEQFPFLDPPDADAVRDGYDTLFELGAITEAGAAGTLTPIGARMARIPVDARLARMLIAADAERSLDEVLVLAAMLSVRDPRERPASRPEDADRAQAVFRHPTSDFMTLLRLWDQYRHAAATTRAGDLAAWCRDHFLSPARMREWSEMVAQLRDVADQVGLRPNRQPASEDAVHRALLTGLISNVACREGDGSFDYRGVRGNVVQVFPGSALFRSGPRWIMAAEIVHTSRLYARTVARIDPEWVERLAGHLFRRQLSDRHLDADSGRPSAWERVTLSTIVVVPRRRVDLAPIDPAAARAIFLRDALAAMKWRTDAQFMRHNREILDRARSVEARLRRRGVLLPVERLAEWFSRRVPDDICEPEAFERWRRGAEQNNPRLLMLSLEDVLDPDARAAIDPAAFPDQVEIGDDPHRTRCEVTYALAPGRDDDGVTISLPLLALPHLSDDRAAWLVPGMLPHVVLGLVRTLPKPLRAAVEAAGRPETLAGECAAAMVFARGSLPAALSEALRVLHEVDVDPAAWSLRSLPPHLRLRVRVIDDAGNELAADRDLAALRSRLAGRLRRAQAAADRAREDRPGLTAWEFGDLPDLPAGTGEHDDGGQWPSLLDEGDSVRLSTLGSARQAAAHTRLGLRRLFAIACRDELAAAIDSLPTLHDMTRHFAPLGSAPDLRSCLAALAADRVFIDGRPPVRTREAFAERLEQERARLVPGLREVADAVAATLEARARVAQRLSGGTPRVWAASVADIREHAAYLMPRGFLAALPWSRLRQYPRYARAMRERLLALREDGTRAEDASLSAILPHWKRFTAWVAAAMAAQRRAGGTDAPPGPTLPSGNGTRSASKAALPQARRAAPTVNVDAGEWAMRPGALPRPIEAYRWAIEEFRVFLFAPTLVQGRPMTAEALGALWREVDRAPDHAGKR